MKKILLILLVLLFVFSPTAFSEEIEESREDVDHVESEDSQEDVLSGFVPTFRNMDITKLNESQMALLMINNQIEYLMSQIEGKDTQIEELNRSTEKRLSEERDFQKELRQEHAEKIEAMENKLSDAENEVQAGKDALHELEKQVAIYLGESGLYLKIGIGFIVGIIVGLVAGMFFSWKKSRSHAKVDTTQA